MRNYEGIDLANGLEIRDGANNNIVESSYIHHCYSGVGWTGGVEKGDGNGYSNKVVNTIFSNMSSSIMRPTSNQSYTLGIEGNKFINCTFYNAKTLFETDGITPHSNNEYIEL